MQSAEQANEKSLQRLTKLVALAETNHLYLDLTGLGCYHKQDVPAWYDKLDEADRWTVQAGFWRAVAERVRNSPAIFCYDLMNEPVVPGGRNAPGNWLGPPFGGSCFVQFVTLERRERDRAEIARLWIKQLKAAIRVVDERHLITVGMVDWSLDRPGLTSGFIPSKLVDELDFVSVHLYPTAGKLAEARATLKGFAAGRPVVVEETFHLRCSPQQLGVFIDQNSDVAAGWISFYWGRTAAEYKKSDRLEAALIASWLESFQRHGPPVAIPKAVNSDKSRSSSP